MSVYFKYEEKYIMVGVYKFTNVLNGKSYVGQSINIRRRYNHHRRISSDIRGGDVLYINTVMHDVGFDNFEFTVLEECSKEELDEKEIYYIKKYNTLIPNGYNISFGGKKGKFQSIKSFDDIKEIHRLLRETDLSEREIGEKFGVSNVTISYINIGKLWKTENVSYPIREERLNHEYKPKFCKRCGVELCRVNNTELCSGCYAKVKGEHIPDMKTIYDDLLKMSFEAVGRKYGVTGNAVKKWCRKYNIPSLASEYIKIRKNKGD
jgi:group I intron endonuclease